MSDLTFDQYQEATRSTRIYPDQSKIIYPALGLAGEGGEVCEKVKKMLRDDNGILTPERRETLMAEVSDVLWYIAALADDIGFSMGEIAAFNLAKLQKRKEQGTLKGDGDNR